MFVHVGADSETARHQLANSRGLRDGDWTWFHGREFLQISPDSRWIYPRCTTRFSETLDFDGFWVAMGSLFDNPTLYDPLAIMAVDLRQGPQDLQSQSSRCRGPYACHMGCLSSISKIGSSNPPKQDHTGDTTKGWDGLSPVLGAHTHTHWMIACSVALWPVRKHSFFDKDTYPRVSVAGCGKENHHGTEVWEKSHAGSRGLAGPMTWYWLDCWHFGVTGLSNHRILGFPQTQCRAQPAQIWWRSWLD